jgi:hypothetical protein
LLLSGGLRARSRKCNVFKLTRDPAFDAFELFLRYRFSLSFLNQVIEQRFASPAFTTISQRFPRESAL